MINLFLKAKHWHLFVLLVGIPILLQGIFMTQIFSTIATEEPPDMEQMFGFFKFLPILMFLFMGVYYGWMWSLGIGLQEHIPEELRPNTNWFKFTMIFPIVYMLFIGFFMVSLFGNIAQLENGEPPNLGYIGLIFPLHFITMFCSIYNLYFVAKTFKTAELQKKVQFGDFVGEFFLVWFFFIGVWFLQPKVNEMAEETYHTDIV